MPKRSNDPSGRLRLSELPRGGPFPFRLEPPPEARAALADELGIEAVKKLRFSGELTPHGRQDWSLAAELGATVVQNCVVTLAPVTTRIDEWVIRDYAAELADPGEATEIEIPADDVEPLPETLDLRRVMTEALALALPLYPRAEGAAAGDTQVAAPGVEPMTDEDARPFAGLRDLRDRMDGDGD